MNCQSIRAEANNKRQDVGEAATFWAMAEREGNWAKVQANRMAFLCSYTPVEIIAACDLIPWRLLPVEQKMLREDIYLHPTLCSYVRTVLEYVLHDPELKGAVLLGSCHALRHFSYTYENLFPQKFHYLLDLPYDSSPAAVEFWSGELRELHRSLARWREIEAGEEALQEQIILYRQNRRRLVTFYQQRKGRTVIAGSELIHLAQASMRLPPHHFGGLLNCFENYNRMRRQEGHFYSGPRLLLMGSLLDWGIINLIEERGGLLILDDLCTGRRAVSFGGEPVCGDDPYRHLARLYLKRSPCARMKNSFLGLQRLEQLLSQYHIDGIILYYLKFCDPWYYLGQWLKERNWQVPVLILEGELTAPGSAGQLRTRIDAFLEMLRQ